MNEILIRKHTKQVMSYGIPKDTAVEIVETSYEAGNGHNMELYINYSIDILYGLGMSQKAKKIF
jgi:hypothetical protein